MSNVKTPYPELPRPWTIAREGKGNFYDDQFFGFNVDTGERTVNYPTYGLALNEVRKREGL